MCMYIYLFRLKDFLVNFGVSLTTYYRLFNIDKLAYLL